MAKNFTSNWMKAVARDAARISREAEANRKRMLREQAAQIKADEHKES